VVTNRSFDNLRINTIGLGDGLSMAADKTKASVTLSGPMLWLDKLKAGDISLTAEVTGLKAGVHSVALMCTVASSEGVAYSYATDPAMVQVTLTAK
jgi:YbbR domain-containing protein